MLVQDVFLLKTGDYGSENAVYECAALRGTIALCQLYVLVDANGQRYLRKN